MSDRIEEVASHIILMSARGDIAPISAKDAWSIAEAVAPCRDEVLAVFRELVAAIDAKHGWHIRAVLEGALAAIEPPSPSTRALSPTSTQEQEGSDE